MFSVLWQLLTVEQFASGRQRHNVAQKSSIVDFIGVDDIQLLNRMDAESGSDVFSLLDASTAA